MSTGPTIEAEPQQPTMSLLMRLIGERDGQANAVIFVYDKAHGPSTARSETLEGATTASDGDWVVRGAEGEEWPVPAREFAERYTELEAPAAATANPSDLIAK